MPFPTRAWRFVQLLFVFYFLEAGAFLMMSPWSTFWPARVVSRAPFALRGLLLSPYFRGFLTGLGVLHVFVAIRDLEAWRRGTFERNEAPRALSPADPRTHE